MRRLLAVCCLVLFVSCAPRADMPLHTLNADDSNDRIKVTRIGVIEDDLAYRERREVFIIEDKKTGKEYIGISGVGICETGSHQEGRTQQRDER